MSRETAFYAEDKLAHRTEADVDIGVRYEWSTPYAERHNYVEFSDFTVEQRAGGSGTERLSPGMDSPAGINIFASNSMRTAPVDRNNVAPRLGFAADESDHGDAAARASTTG